MVTTTETLTSTLKLSGTIPLQADFRYWAEQRENREDEILAIINGTTTSMQTTTLEVYDVRPSMKQINHETHGFQFVNHESQFVQLSQDGFDLDTFNSHSAEFAQETIELVKESLGARSAVASMIISRESSPEAHTVTVPRPLDLSKVPPSKPFHIAHCDTTHHGSRANLRALRPDFFELTQALAVTTQEERDEFFRLRKEVLDAEESAMAKAGISDYRVWNGANYEGPRWAQFSIWRPAEVVQREPLAMLDTNTLFGEVSHHDLEHRPYSYGNFPARARTGYNTETDYHNMMPYLPKNGEHKWLYLKDQKPSEVNFLKLFDSEAWKEGSAVAPCAVHSAFTLPDEAGKPTRKSIETRVTVIW